MEHCLGFEIKNVGRLYLLMTSVLGQYYLFMGCC